jgi:outer membrane lipoprotein SlyB
MKKTSLLLGLIFAFIISASNTTFAQQKKGMSSQAKGAIIGGSAGAIAGTAIGGNVKGTLIGTAIGAGGGYVIGNEARRKKEKKERAQYKATHTRKQYFRRYGTYN